MTIDRNRLRRLRRRAAKFRGRIRIIPRNLHMYNLDYYPPGRTTGRPDGCRCNSLNAIEHTLDRLEREGRL
jgi:hypothetical protein